MLNESSKRCIRFPPFRSSKSQKNTFIAMRKMLHKFMGHEESIGLFHYFFYIVGLNEYLLPGLPSALAFQGFL